MAGSIQRAVKLDERKGFESGSCCPVVQSDKQQKAEGAGMTMARKAALQLEALQRLSRRRVTEGSAGGFFDRQDAGDRKQYDSDEEEFDDFGRRKKRRKDATAPAGRKEERYRGGPASSSQAPVRHYSLASANETPPARPSDDDGRVEGTVRWYESSKAFGFLRTPSIDADIYFKDNDRTLAPVEGMRVTFKLINTPDGKVQARNVMRGNLASVPYESAHINKMPIRAFARDYDEGDDQSAASMMSHPSMLGLLGHRPLADDQTAATMMRHPSMLGHSPAASNAMLQASPSQSAPIGHFAGIMQMMQASLQPQAPAPTESSEVMMQQMMQSQLLAACTQGQDTQSAFFNWTATQDELATGSAPSIGGGTSLELGGTGIGIVKSFNLAKGAGFIASSVVEGDIYFKGSFPNLTAGKPVTFKLSKKADKWQGYSIKVLD